MSRRFWTSTILTISFTQVFAQHHEQLWLDYQLDYPFANDYLFETSASYQTLLDRETTWTNLTMTPVCEYSLFSFVDAIVEVPLAYTRQSEDTSSFEISPDLGARIHITQNRRINTRLLVKYQQRYFKLIEDNDWNISNRIRLKAEATICINGPNLFVDKLWYAILDYEEYIVLDDQVQERYANRRRGRVGLGYRLNYKNRFELIYTRQSSRNEIEGSFIGNDNIIQIRYKMFLHPAHIK